MKSLLIRWAWAILDRWWPEWRWTVYVDGSPVAQFDIREGIDPEVVREHVDYAMTMHAADDPNADVFAWKTIDHASIDHVHYIDEED